MRPRTQRRYEYRHSADSSTKWRIRIIAYSSRRFRLSSYIASAINVAKVLIDTMTKHAYLPTTLITDKGTAFTSTTIRNYTILGIKQKVQQPYIRKRS